MSEKQFDFMIRAAVEKAVVEPDFEYSAVIKAGQISIPVMAVVSITYRHDYINDLFADNAITVAVTPSSYNDIMSKASDRLTLTLTKKPFLGTVTSSKDYIAIISDKTNARVEGNDDAVQGANKLDDGNIRLVNIQLMDKPSFDIRLRSFGGIFSNQSGHNVLKYFLGSIDLSGAYGTKDTVGSLNSVGLPFDRVYREISVPEGTPLLAVPDYLQDNYGVYTSGLGVFFKDRNWYMFPPWAVSRQSGTEKTLTIINAPANRYNGLDRNYFERGKTLTVVVTGETKYISETDTNNLNLGTAVRFADAEKLLSGVTTEDPTVDPVVNAADYITEYGHTDFKGALQNVVTAAARFISNPAVPASELARRGGDIVTVTWHKGDIQILRPGMPVLFYYRTTSGVREMKGTLISALQHSTVDGTLADRKHISYVTMQLFLKEGS